MIFMFLIKVKFRLFLFQLNFSRKELSKKSGLIEQYIYKLESGKVNTTLDKACILAYNLDLSLDDMVTPKYKDQKKLA